MRLLNRNVGTLAKLASNEPHRYAIAGVHIAECEGGYVAQATDGRYAAIVECTNAPSEEDYPTIPALEAAPNGKTSAIIPAKALAAACKAAPKSRVKPVLQTVAIVIGENEATLATTNLETSNVVPTRNIEGRFPDIRGAFPKEGRMTATFRVDAARLAELLTVAAQFANTEGGAYPAVDLIIGADGPMVIRTERAGEKFSAIIMPLSK